MSGGGCHGWLRLRILGRYCPCVIPVQLHSRHARVVLSAKSMLSNYQGGLAVSCLCRSRSRLPSTSDPQVQSSTSSVPPQILSPVPPRVLDPTLKVLPRVQLQIRQTTTPAQIPQRLLGPVPPGILNPVPQIPPRIQLHHHTSKQTSLQPSVPVALGFHDTLPH